ncbi:type 2 lanthipeptide synthetase LanM [Halorussus caseinilyticus]|uniref:type 2 lanthipeptide synthetase LanM n=1 Tax=Halorussus caseinilyticus TaxID=3034025 RepID=UPI0023E8F451|nr:type 2 lanthipeptide synthetase LanM [Halorussus sp. DT72]
MDVRNLAASAELIQERIDDGHRAPTEDGTTLEAFDYVDESLAEELRENFGSDAVEYANLETWPNEKLPDWVEAFGDVYDRLKSVREPLSGGERREVPFREIVAPIADHCVESVLDSAPTARLSDDAIASLEAQLLDRLTDLCAQPLHLDFIRFIVERDPEVIADERRSPDSREWYESYVRAFYDGRMESFFEEYAMVARLLSVVTTQWRESVAEFAERLHADYDDICGMVGEGTVGDVARVESNGDPHERGRSVFRVEFERGEVFYKPRELDAEREFYGFLNWLADRFDAFPTLPTPALRTRGDYGWMESVERATLTSKSDVERYYRKTGALSFVLYLLNVSDCHGENLLASDESAVLVDAETVLAPSLYEVPRTELFDKLRKEVHESSVLKTQMVQLHDARSETDKSGLGVNDAERATTRTLVWTHVNTDAMDFEYRRPGVEDDENYPLYEGDPAPPELFADRIVEGFEAAYDAVASAPDEVKDDVTDRFDGVRLRCVLQDTAQYESLLNTLTNPTPLRNGVVFGNEIRDTLSKTWAEYSTTTPESVSEIVAAEREALLRRDVPKFHTSADAEAITFEDETVCRSAAAGLERVQRRIDRLSAEDRTFQTGLIESCLRGSDVPESERELPGNRL